MGLKLQNEFTVAAPLDTTWSALLDIERVARCMPGATIEPGAEDGVHRGTMKVRLGPMTVAYQGTVRLAEVDVDDHVCLLDVQAREHRGQGTAAAAITNRLIPEGDATRVVVETDLAITGRQAQFGRGIMADVSATVLADFARRLEREILSPQAAAEPQGDGGPAGDAPPRPAPSPAAEALDLGGAVGPLGRRVGAGAAVAGLLALGAWLLGRHRRRKGFELRLRYR